jgi:hypothetical protein
MRHTCDIRDMSSVAPLNVLNYFAAQYKISIRQCSSEGIFLQRYNTMKASYTVSVVSLTKLKATLNFQLRAGSV